MYVLCKQISINRYGWKICFVSEFPLVGNKYGKRFKTEVVIGNFSTLVLEGKITNTPSSYSSIVWSTKKKNPVSCQMPCLRVSLSFSHFLSLSLSLTLTLAAHHHRVTLPNCAFRCKTHVVHMTRLRLVSPVTHQAMLLSVNTFLNEFYKNLPAKFLLNI